MGVNMNDSNLKNALVLYFCGYEKCSASHSFGPASRPHYLIHYIIQGKGCYFENGKEHHLSAGDSFLITPGKSTYYIADATQPWEYCWIGFDGYDASNILEQCNLTESSLIHHTDGSDIEKNYLELIRIFSENSGNAFTYLSYLYKIFSYMISKPRNNISRVSENYINDALGYIHQNYIYDINISDVAKYIGIDRTYLYRLFMEKKNISPQQYLIDYRLQAVCRHLLETNLSVTQIAYSCGFMDASSLNKHFKKKLHITPLQYRKIDGKRPIIL
jgi:AraC-like DNA-binding protein